MHHTIRYNPGASPWLPKKKKSVRGNSTRRLKKMHQPVDEDDTPKLKLYKIGTIVNVIVPPDRTVGFKPLVGARGHVVSREKFSGPDAWVRDIDFVVVKITDAPNDDKKMLSKYDNYYPVRRSWLRATENKICTCPMVDLMRWGCKCGGV